MEETRRPQQTPYRNPRRRPRKRRPKWQRLLSMLPPQLVDSYASLVLEDDEAVLPTVKAADKLSAYIKCVEEQKAGNTEFDSAAKQSMESMLKMDMPELQWFIDNCLEPFSLNIDQL